MKKKVLIFGKDGQLGFDLNWVFGENYHKVALNRQNLDITDAQAVKNVIQKEKPDIVINATAYNKVETADTERKLAFIINGEAVGNIANAVKEIGAVFIHISSDYVFDGTKEFFIEEDIPNPLNIYGQSKLVGEQLVKTFLSNFYIVRTSGLFGVKQSGQKINFVDRMVALAKDRQLLKVVSDQRTCPTYSLDLATKIKELIEMTAPFGIYHITCSGSCSWYEFAAEILELMNLDADLLPISTSESGTKVNRPKNSVLKNQALEKIRLPPMPVWQNALRRYLREKYKI